MKREMNNMKNSQTTAGQKPQTVPARVLREQLCQRAMEASQQLPLRGTADLQRRAASIRCGLYIPPIHPVGE